MMNIIPVNFNQKNYSINSQKQNVQFKALFMPNADKFMPLGEKCVKELESIRPNIEQMSNIYSDLDLIVKPFNSSVGSLLTVAAMRPKGGGHAGEQLDINSAMQEAKQQSMSFGEYIIDLLKEFADAARNGAI